MPGKRQGFWLRLLGQPSFYQWIKFNLVGLMNTGVDFAVFAALSGLGMGSALAQVASYSAGMVNSYWMNKSVTFKDQGGLNGRIQVRWQFIRFIILNVFVLAISLIMLQLAVNYVGVHILIAKTGITFITMLINFYGARRWVYQARQYSSGD